MYRLIITLIVRLQIPDQLNGRRNQPGKTSNDLSIKVVDTLELKSIKGSLFREYALYGLTMQLLSQGKIEM